MIDPPFDSRELNCLLELKRFCRWRGGDIIAECSDYDSGNELQPAVRDQCEVVVVTQALWIALAKSFAFPRPQ